MTILSLTRGSNVTLDESSGLQNDLNSDLIGDLEDNDIAASSLPSAFSARLTALNAGTPIDAALSGYNGSNTGTNAFTFNVTGFSGMAFTDSTGAALNGLDSGLNTAGGADILLYTDSSNNNIVLGKTSAGAIVFAGFLDETGTTGAKIWTVQYEAIFNPDNTNPDDAVSLTNKIFVTVDQALQFSLANAPSGQNLFLTLGDAAAAIIVTGKNPADQSSGASITTGDTVNTSQGGGSTTIGNTNQMIDPNEGMYFTFVTGAHPDLTIPNLDHSEAILESNIQYDNFLTAQSASFNIVQLQSGKAATIKISAFTPALEKGADYIDANGLTNTGIVAIKDNSIVVRNGLTDVTSARTIDYTGSTATIKGVLAGDVISYSTDTEHSRLLVENVGTGSAKAAFDIGGFSLQQGLHSTAEIGSQMLFEDDGPSIALSGVAAPVLTVDETELATNASASFAGQFTPTFGTDGAGSSGVTYALSVAAGSTGIVDTATNQAVVLSVVSGVVQGKTATSGDLVFTVSVDGGGNVTLDQIRAIVHPDASNPNDAKTLAAANLVALTATATDKDGDSASTTLNIGQTLVFRDDGPSIALSGVATPVLTVDETVLATNASASFAAQFTPTFGADGAGSGGVTYALGVAAGSTGIVDTATNQAVVLTVVSGVVQGKTATSGDLVFTVSVDGGGNVTLDQIRAIVHPDATNPNDSKTLAAANLVTLTATDTDKDGDSASATLNIGQSLVFKDDGPALAFGNLVGTGTTLAQTGYWTHAAGSDGLGAAGLDIALTGFTLVRPDNSTTPGILSSFSELAGSPNGSGAYLFGGTLTGDFDNNAGTADTSVNFSLTAYNDGHYTLDLVEGFASTVIRSSADGSLDAGGPDPVRTLTISPEQIVFFAANALAPQTGANSIQTGIGLGASDPTEAQLQTSPLPSYIGSASMNVSTSGIGVGNNLLQGNTTVGIDATDESFVINPKSLLTGMKIFIDNSVAGYDMATEDLYYRTYYTDGTVSATTEVNTVTPESGGQVSFLIQREGSKLIDAVQLLMGRGEIKIPVIQFIQETDNLANDVKLDFSATLTDKDGDTATDVFSTALYANKLNAAFDFTLVGTGSAQDAFNIDLSSSKTGYQVSGFDIGMDKLVLIGDATAVVQSINNGGADSIVTITETGGQTTTVTVVGVDLNAASDIVFG
jgi:hypothetical protein